MLELPKSFYLLKERGRSNSRAELKQLVEIPLTKSKSAVLPTLKQLSFIMNKAMFCLVFLSGMFMAMFLGGLFGEYMKVTLMKGSRDRTERVGRLPDASYLAVLEESRLELFSETPVAELASKVRSDVGNPESPSDKEAMNSLAAAIEMKNNGKVEKAMKLFKHAIALGPKNPNVLNSYGEFVESERKDLVLADHLFARAIAFSEMESDTRVRAVANRQRTALKVEEIDKHVLRNIDHKKRLFLDVPESSSALVRAKKEAYFQYVYHTVGIEGNTMSLAQTRSILETKLAVAGKSIMEHNEILGMDAALKYINQTLVDKLGDITLQDILAIHKRVIGHVDPIEAGLFRRTQVYVGDHVPPPPQLVDSLVDHFIQWLNSYEALSLHPVRLAALAHYKLVFIHPFVDGNGRTSRLLMNLVLMRAGFPPVIIRRADREIYYHYLKVANEGDIRPFVRFIARCTEKTLDAYLWAAKEYSEKDQIEQAEASLPPNLIENNLQSLEQFHSSLRNLQPSVPKESFLDFTSTDKLDKILVPDPKTEDLQVDAAAVHVDTWAVGG